MFKQTMIGLTGAVALGAGFAGGAEALTLNFQNDDPSTNLVDSISALNVGGILYDVNFESGTVFDVFGDPPNFTFGGDASTALVAAQSIADALGSDLGISESSSERISDSFFVPYALENDRVQLAWDASISVDNDQFIELSTFSASEFYGVGAAFATDLSWATFTRVDDTQPVPEPASMLGLLAVGVVAASGALKKKASV